ncbi:malonic semialdehyde reductase [Streptomyces acidicola]|uniref:Malonic semialdehyde reductase n=1 Tax=Streptomyces acidicola TaxID=2596892 RepID=A0A5N8WJ15_9ACTN|nr:malonic semialdehyde reductase [Streptomyces acidicola]MPY47421.1 malonic semialdehyde reductase [Streptomyces acidicola]
MTTHLSSPGSGPPSPVPLEGLQDHDGLDAAGRRLLFQDARTVRTFSGRPVPDELLVDLWNLAQWPPTALNSQPLRIVHVRSPGGKQRLLPLVDEGNREKTRQAPVTSVLAADLRFHDRLPELFPVHEGLREVFEARGRPHRDDHARFNTALQIGYFLLAARAVGLSAGPMAGFDSAAVTREFLVTDHTDHVSALLLVNLGYPGAEAYRPRLPRLPVGEVVGWA